MHHLCLLEGDVSLDGNGQHVLEAIDNGVWDRCNGRVAYGEAHAGNVGYSLKQINKQ